MSSAVPDEIQQFFADFEEASRAEAWARYGELFLPAFLSLDPESGRPVSRDDLIAFLPHRKALFDRAGATGTVLASLEAETMDSRHVLARTSWDVLFDHQREPVVLRSTFLLRREDRWWIAVYLNHESLLELLADEQEIQ
jgi:hypothetical protein